MGKNNELQQQQQQIKHSEVRTVNYPLTWGDRVISVKLG